MLSFRNIYEIDGRIKVLLGNFLLGIIKGLILKNFIIKKKYGIKEMLDIKCMITLAYINDAGNDFRILMNN